MSQGDITLSRFIKFPLTGMIFILYLMVGCNGNPSSPDPISSPDTGEAKTRSGNACHMNLGQYLIELDTQNLTVEPIPLRSSELHLNLTKIFVSRTICIAVFFVNQTFSSLNMFRINITDRYNPDIRQCQQIA